MISEFRQGRVIPRMGARWGLVSALLLSAACTEANGPELRGASPAATTPERPAFRAALHRLNTTEYNATVADVLGTKLEPAIASWRGGESHGFDNMAPVLGVDPQQYEKYFAAAKALATEVVDSPALLARFAPCDLALRECVTASIQSAGLRLFRRPLTPDELQVYAGLHAQALERGDNANASFELVLQALLSSAQFIYRIELEPALGEGAFPAEVGPFDLASRLSYFLWSSAPDEPLLAAAAEGALLAETTLVQTVDRMLADPRANRFVKNFAGQWLGARRVIAHAVAPELYEWTPLVAPPAAEEMIHYFAEFVSQDLPWPDFLRKDVNFVTEPLARYYRFPLLSVRFARVEQTDDERAGFLGLAGFLALSSYDRRTSPSLRGRFIAENLLCAELPPPPPGVAKLEASSGASEGMLNVRQTLDLHRQDPACSSCHAVFDPYGLALEAFDAVGQYRTHYADGSPVDATATLPSGQSFSGLSGVSEVVATDPRFGECLARKLLTYGLGRPLETSDEESLRLAVERWHAPGSEAESIRRLLHELVLSSAFRSHLTESAL